ncbi:HAMP domain-containing histidine kinase [Virgibacillus sp. NKC19-3]|uniref:sensor histidine kinase n=1 Tax=Virgibacillus saliphilus TaxID=2831674 RepID=UPI001C9B5539|nr:HAMP domain-containing sensor histidine kinase [Virgibacillus sp. NKC19-3]MBY7142617.1 HAMP domain-containing histidine kinase [Virgibacillus sp. NKC19-3]
MDGVIRIIRRYFMSTILISFLLIAVNFILLGTLIFRDELSNTPSPKKIMERLTEDLALQDGEYTLHNRSQKFLQNNDAWAMLLDHDGEVMWEYDLPEDVPRSYGLVDVAKFSRYYLNDYPVYTWEQQGGLFVVGYPKASLWKYQFQFWSEGAQSTPLRIGILLVINIAMAIFISFILSTKLIKGIRPLISGIHDLSREKKVNVNTKGLFRDVAASINTTSSKIQENKKALEERDEARSNWIAGISHDIRTPLSIILGYASELEDNKQIPAAYKDQAAIIRRHTEKIRELVNNLNLVSMLEYEMQPLHLKEMRPSAIVREVAADFLNGGLEEKYNIHFQISNEAGQIIGDEKLLSRALTNLIQNSITHNPQGCNIVLETKRSEDHTMYCFIVSDDGIGIPEAFISELTSLPYTSKNVNDVKQGHGLGLPMVSRIVEAHEGVFSMENHASQKGVKMTMCIPLSK